MRGALISLVIFLAPIQAMADYENRSDWWLKECGTNYNTCVIFVIAFIKGAQLTSDAIKRAIEATNAANSKNTHPLKVIKSAEGFVLGCRGKRKINMGQYTAIWIEYLQKTPQDYDLTPETTFPRALREAFPCK